MKKRTNKNIQGIIMSLEDTVNKLGHYAKKAIRAVTKPVNTVFALSTMAVALSILPIQETQAQSREIQGDTIYGTGIFSTKNAENNDPVKNVQLYLRPISMAMITPDTTYEFLTDNDGMTEFNLPVYIDSTTGIKDLIENKPQILPTFGNEMNAFFQKIEKGTIEIYNMSGQLVKKQDFNTDHEYLQFNDMAAGMYIYNIRTESGIELGGKFLKQNTPLHGPTSRPSNNVNSSFKEVQLYTAIYSAKWVHPDFETDSIEIELEDGNNGFVKFYMTPLNPSVPQHQDVQGIAKDDENNNLPLENVTAILFNETYNETTEITTGSDGVFTFENVPAGSVCYISIGGLEDYYSFNDQTYNVPVTIEYMEDTIATVADVVLYEQQSAITNLNILKQQTRHGTQEQIRTYWFHSSVPTGDVPEHNSNFSQYDAMTNDYSHIQVTDSINADIIVMGGGSWNTTTATTLVETPLGTYEPVTKAFMYIGTNSFGSFSHELGQADAKSQCGGTGYLSSDPPPTGPDSQDVAIGELEMKHWVFNVYANQETYFDLNNIDETLDNKSPEFKASQSNSLGADIEINYINK